MSGETFSPRRLAFSLGDDTRTELVSSSPDPKRPEEQLESTDNNNMVRPNRHLFNEEQTQQPQSTEPLLLSSPLGAERVHNSNNKDPAQQQGIEQDDTTPTNNNNINETGDERRRREEEESLELARMLMAEEAMHAHYHSVQMLRESRDQLSQEDYEALEAALQEEEQTEAVAEGNLEEDEEGNLSYETMLQLGERIGDVKSDRWTMECQTHIARLPTVVFDGHGNLAADADDSEHKCLVCQHEYSRGEDLRRLPCGHCFHTECVDQWLSRTDLCPYCRTSIVAVAKNPKPVLPTEQL